VTAGAAACGEVAHAAKRGSVERRRAVLAKTERAMSVRLKAVRKGVVAKPSRGERSEESSPRDRGNDPASG
jgi:hypothetical protein